MRSRAADNLDTSGRILTENSPILFNSSYISCGCPDLCSYGRFGKVSHSTTAAKWIPGGMRIRVDDLRGPEIAALLEAHLALMRSNSPPESVHALDLDGLRRPEITFWTVWEDAELLACGALKELDPTQGEIKSMHTAQAARGRGVARRLVQHILDEARRRGYRRLSLETGATDDFAPARRLYSTFGFEYCGPFADYPLHPFSAFMTLELAPAEAEPLDGVGEQGGGIGQRSGGRPG